MHIVDLSAWGCIQYLLCRVDLVAVLLFGSNLVVLCLLLVDFVCWCWDLPYVGLLPIGGSFCHQLPMLLRWCHLPLSRDLWFGGLGLCMVIWGDWGIIGYRCLKYVCVSISLGGFVRVWRKPSVLQLVRQLVYAMFISNNRSFHLWWNENLVKHQNVSKYYENDCGFVFLFQAVDLLYSTR